jgi:hypothetical protein
MGIATAASDPAITALVYVVATVAAAGVLGLTHHLYKQGKSQSAIHEAVLGRPASQGVPKILGVLERMDLQDVALTQIDHEVMENNGTSIKDTVRTIDTKLTTVSDKLDNHILTVTKVADAFSAKEKKNKHR